MCRKRVPQEMKSSTRCDTGASTRTLESVLEIELVVWLSTSMICEKRNLWLVERLVLMESRLQSVGQHHEPAGSAFALLHATLRALSMTLTSNRRASRSRSPPEEIVASIARAVNSGVASRSRTISSGDRTAGKLRMHF